MFILNNAKIVTAEINSGQFLKLFDSFCHPELVSGSISICCPHWDILHEIIDFGKSSKQVQHDVFTHN